MLPHLHMLATGAQQPGRPALVGIDGRSGTGKTTLAAGLRRGLRDADVTVAVIHMDGLYPGWEGLAPSQPVVKNDLLAPLRRGESASYRLWNWTASTFGAMATVPPRNVVIVEGVGSVTANPSDYDVRVWLTASSTVRRQRALERDGSVFEPHWDRWSAQENVFFADPARRFVAHVGVRALDV